MKFQFCRDAKFKVTKLPQMKLQRFSLEVLWKLFNYVFHLSAYKGPLKRKMHEKRQVAVNLIFHEFKIALILCVGKFLFQFKYYQAHVLPLRYVKEESEGLKKSQRGKSNDRQNRQMFEVCGLWVFLNKVLDWLELSATQNHMKLI